MRAIQQHEVLKTFNILEMILAVMDDLNAVFKPGTYWPVAGARLVS